MEPKWKRMGCIELARVEKKQKQIPLYGRPFAAANENKSRRDADATKSLGAFLAWVPPVAEELEDDERSAQNDCGVGQVERVPVMFADVKIDEVGDAAAQNAVENIAGRPAKNQRETPLA